VEHEDCDLLIAIDPHPEMINPARMAGAGRLGGRASQWAGHANCSIHDDLPLAGDQSGEPGDAWSIASTQADAPNYPPLAEPSKAPAAKIILNRRSAQRFDRKLTMSADTFYRMLDCLLVRPIAPWDVWTYSPRLHLIFFIHRVEDWSPAYMLPRTRRRTSLQGPFGQISSGRGSMMPLIIFLRQTYARRLQNGRQAGELPSSDRE